MVNSLRSDDSEVDSGAASPDVNSKFNFHYGRFAREFLDVKTDVMFVFEIQRQSKF